MIPLINCDDPERFSTSSCSVKLFFSGFSALPSDPRSNTEMIRFTRLYFADTQSIMLHAYYSTSQEQNMTEPIDQS